MNISKITYLDVLGNVSSCLSLDISVRSTGWIIWENGKLTYGTESLQTESLTDRRVEFRAFLEKLIGQRHFDFISVEDVIGGVNFRTNRELFQLNTIVDDMMEYKVIPISSIERENNSQWKRFLRVLSQDKTGIKGSQDKEEIVFILNSLGFKENVKQDIYDALGLALGVIANKVLKIVDKEHEAKQHKLHESIRTGYMVKGFLTSSESSNYIDKFKSKYALPVLQVSNEDINGSLENGFKEYVREHGDENIFVINIESKKVGVVAMLYDIDLSLDVVYLVVRPKWVKRKCSKNAH